MLYYSKGRLSPSLFFIVLLTLVNQPSHAFDVYGRLESFTWSEPVTIDAARNDWETESFNGGENQWSSSWVETGFTHKKWHIGYLQRLELDLRFSPDTADYYYRTENEQPLESGKTYDLYLRAQKVRLEGFRIGRQHRIGSNVLLDWGLSYMHADDLIDGDIQGDDKNLELDYHYSEDSLLDRIVERPDGKGLALDVTAKWDISEDSTLEVSVEDLYSRIRWDDAPFTTASASANQNTYDENGVLTIKPLVSGYEGIDDHYDQKLDPKTQIDLSQQLKPAKLELSYLHRSRVNLWALGGKMRLGEQALVGLKLWPDIDSLELSAQWQKLVFSVAIDSTDWNKTNAVWLNVRYN